MKILLNQYKQVIFFVIRFFISYGILFGLYQWYLNNYKNTVDIITKIIATNTVWVLNIIDNGFHIKEYEGYAFVDVYIKNTVLYRIIEGCNGISLMILFCTFVFSFKGDFKKIFFYIPSGLLLIHLINIFRLVVMVFVIMYFDSYEKFFHDIFFPSIIYGIVFLLCYNWIRIIKSKRKITSDLKKI